MKHTFKILAILCFLIQHNIYSQQLVNKISDAYQLEDYKSIFINKPLKNLLKEIKPEIKTAHVFNEDDLSLFLFRFTNIEQKKKREGTAADRVSLLVYVNQPILWRWSARLQGKELDWTKEDATKFANLTVTNIEIIEKN